MIDIKKRAIFLDRDGIINVDSCYVYRKEKFIFLDGIFDVLKRLQEMEYLLFIVTNQSGIARGYYSEREFKELNSWMIKIFKHKKIKITKVYYCPHAPDDGCDCRKPKAGMINMAKNDFNVDIQKSWMIGDKPSDIEAGLNAGILNTIFIGDSICKKSKYSIKSILDIINIIKKEE